MRRYRITRVKVCITENAMGKPLEAVWRYFIQRRWCLIFWVNHFNPPGGYWSLSSAHEAWKVDIKQPLTMDIHTWSL